MARGETEGELGHPRQVVKEGHAQKAREPGDPGGTAPAGPQGFREPDDPDEANEDDEGNEDVEEEAESVYRRGPGGPVGGLGADMAFKGLWHPKRCTADQVGPRTVNSAVLLVMLWLVVVKISSFTCEVRGSRIPAWSRAAVGESSL